MDTEQTGALILGTTYRALGVVRSLARNGIAVRLVDSDDGTIAALSRYARRPIRWRPGNGEDGIDRLLEIAGRHRLEGWTLIPTDDETAALVSRGRDRLGTHYLVAAAEWDAMRFAHDKRLTCQLCQELGVDHPRTRFGADIDEPGAAWDGPSILKPAIKHESSRLVRDKAWPVADRASLHDLLARARESVPADEVMLQELIPGDGQGQLSYAALADRGRVLGSITARRIRQQPMDFGRQSTYVESIIAPEVAAAGRRVIEALRYTGLIEVEFKRDARDGRSKLLDINPRAWGWHTLGARAGVDFPYLEWRMLHGQPVAEAHARPGVRWVRMATDLPTVAREIAARRMSVRGYLASLRGPLEHAMFAWDDPLPGFADLPVTAAVHARRMINRRLSSRG